MKQEFEHWNNREDILRLIKRLVAIPSISGTEEENDMASEILAILKEIPYFKENPSMIFEESIENDSLNRKTVAALLKGKQKSRHQKTIILLSHYDVVGIEDYGYLKPYAFDPDRYTEMLKSEALPLDAEKDLSSGDWLFARGIMDMKAGLALQIALISEWSQSEDFEGNLLLLAAPDEERNSEGMFAGVKLLTALKEKYGLHYELCFCSEPSFSSFPGDESKYIYLGSAGKLLPLIFCTGKETHVGEPLEGINASWMASAFTMNMELSRHFREEVSGEKNPLPTALKLADLKDHYNVQTPAHAYVLYNILTLSQSPQEVMDKLVVTAKKSSEDIYRKLQTAFQSENVEKNEADLHMLKPAVYTYSALFSLGLERYGESFRDEMQHCLNQATNPDFDYRQLTIELAKTISGYFTDLAPFYLILFAPPYYPHVTLNGQTAKEDRLLELAEKTVMQTEEKFGVSLKTKNYFTGLSDVSYCRLMDADKVIPVLEKEMPLYGRRYHVPLSKIMDLDIPSINIGPYGKDAHKRTERLEIPFSTEVMPAIMKEFLKEVLSADF
ncbi:Arginine utilization protein RocB [Bacillus sp. OV322]|uniref:M20/M25/M40 family metallo-hydrolase n=1 Tax=Bacillus sp. OV322 TaxID=1882764 RepID=UPI0008EDCAE3|nr:M20/M25/M40 family metallo-hydrolase [Bacillus sp. OV322]SFC86452.1 Arginine utilization protein RocB [Bacillus sp. OV322]